MEVMRQEKASFGEGGWLTTTPVRVQTHLESHSALREV
jgi:hypothetical protein